MLPLDHNTEGVDTLRKIPDTTNFGGITAVLQYLGVALGKLQGLVARTTSLLE